MTAASSSDFPVRFTVLVFLPLLLSVASSSGQPCIDGSYEHAGRSCCLCGVGLYLEEHCTTNLKHGQCKECAPDTYSSHPNYQKSCEPCTSCSQPNANLVVDEPCTAARDTKCRCKKGHYCNSGTETCRICHPCQECGPEGIKAACTAKTNTVCNAITEGGNNTGKIVGITVSVLVIAAALAFACFLKKRRDRRRRGTSGQNLNGNARDVEMQPLNAPVVDLQPHLSDIADVIGWNDMKEIAMRSNIKDARIESCKLNHPGNSQEQTIELLKMWEEGQGTEASMKLVQILQDCGKRKKAEAVMEILMRPSHPA